MDHTSIILLLVILFNVCHSKPLKIKRDDEKAVRFTLNGHQFQIGLLTMPETTTAVTDECMKCAIEKSEITQPETQTITQFALLNLLPKVSDRFAAEPRTAGKLNESMITWNKIKSLYTELGNMLQIHEKELVPLMQRQENSKVAVGADTPSGETSIRVKINDDVGSRNDALKDYDRQLSDSGADRGDPNSLNIHVHAEPPLKMRTVIGYPKSSRNNYSLKKRSGPYNHESSYLTTKQDLIDKVKTRRRSQDQLNEEAFLRRGSELLLYMWKRFKAQKMRIKSQELESQNFHEDIDDTNITNHFSY